MTAPTRSGARAAGWVLALVLLGAAGGLLLAALVPPMPGPPGPGGGPGRGPTGINRLAEIVSVIDLVLLLALLAVYLRTYLETRAGFALGLTIFLAALTLESTFGSPLLFGAFGYGPGGLGPFLLASYGFGTVALAVFLYLSLE